MRYSSQYEERLDPFASFSKKVLIWPNEINRDMFHTCWPEMFVFKERQRRYLSLSPWDKATLSLVSLWLTRTFSRLLCNMSLSNPSFLCVCVSLRDVWFSPTRWPAPLPSSTPCFCIAWSSWCCIRRLGARASAGTAQHFALKSEQSLNTSDFSMQHLITDSHCSYLPPTGTLTTSTVSMRATKTSNLSPVRLLNIQSVCIFILIANHCSS